LERAFLADEPGRRYCLQGAQAGNPNAVIPAKAGIQFFGIGDLGPWIPALRYALAGMTRGGRF
jgi:hypothetical protein